MELVQSTKNLKKWKFWFVKVFICNQILDNKLLNALCAFMFNLFHDQRWDFIAYTLLCLIHQEVDARHIWRKYFKRKMWKINIVYLKKWRIGKGLFVLLKGHVRLIVRRLFKWDCFNEASDPRTIFLSKICPHDIYMELNFVFLKRCQSM